MLNEITEAFERQDYRTAARLVQELLQQSPQDPWGQFYRGRLYEISSKLDEAETVYRQLLRDTANPKLMGQARQGIQRIEATLQARRQAAIAQATADPTNQEPGFMILEAVTGEIRSAVVQSLSRVMKVDAYTARFLIPNRGWRLYRAGSVGELQVYGQELQAAGVPVFWASSTEIQKIQVFRVEYFQSLAAKPTVICQNEQGQLGQLAFDWSEVSQRVEGMLPIFEQVLELGYRDRPERKEKTQDYALFCDLHLPDRQCILRIHDSRYKYEQGAPVLSSQSTVNSLDRNTIRTNWNGLMDVLNHQAPQAPVWGEFTTFGETAADFAVPLGRLKPYHIYLSRDSERYWDPAFHLYSSLIFLHQQARSLKR
jgi:hypothetical protein